MEELIIVTCNRKKLEWKGTIGRDLQHQSQTLVEAWGFFEKTSCYHQNPAGVKKYRDDNALGMRRQSTNRDRPLIPRLLPLVMGTVVRVGTNTAKPVIFSLSLSLSFLPPLLFSFSPLPKSFFTLYQSLAMFSASLSLGLALLPFVSAAIIDIQVGAAGKLAYSPEAIVNAPIFFIFHPVIYPNFTGRSSW